MSNAGRVMLKIGVTDVKIMVQVWRIFYVVEDVKRMAMPRCMEIILNICTYQVLISLLTSHQMRTSFLVLHIAGVRRCALLLNSATKYVLYVAYNNFTNLLSREPCLMASCFVAQWSIR